MRPPLAKRRMLRIRKGRWIMSSTMSEVCEAEVVFVSAFENPAMADIDAYRQVEAEVWTQNMDAMRVNPEALDAFIELVYGCDTEYMEQVEEHVPSIYDLDELHGEGLVDWSTVTNALGESQKILIGVQALLSETLAEMGVEDYRDIRVFSDMHGMMRLLSDHERQEEIEARLNSDENRPLRELYNAATNGMSVAGGLVGTVSLPKEVLAKLKEKILAQAS